MQPKYILVDCETGGFDGTSLLTVYFGLVDKDFKLIDDLYLYTKPDDGIYRVQAQALGVNKINLIDHEVKAITYKEAGTNLYEFLKEHTGDGKFKPQPLGHNVNFDIKRVTQDLMTPNTWQQFVSYRLLDTGTLGSALKDAGRIPSDISGSLSSYCQFFEIDASRAHDAQGDCVMTLQVYKKMLGLIRG